MKTRRTTKRADSRSGRSAISFRFEVGRPPFKNGRGALHKTSLRFKAAYTVFRRRHPNSVPVTGKKIPPTKCSPLEYVEWAIWKARERWADATWDNWFLGFYEKLVKSESLQAVCQDRCKSPDAAYALLGLLLWDADRFKRDETSEEHVEEGGEGRIGQEAAREILERTSDPDAKQLLKIQELVSGLTVDYILAVKEARTPVGERTPYHRKTLAELIDGFVEVFAEEANVRAQAYPNSAQQGSGRPADGLTSPDMFCALVHHFVQEAVRGNDPIAYTIRIIQDFAPGLLKDNRVDRMDEANALVRRLKALKKKKGAIKEFNALVTLYKTRRSFSSIMKTFQPE